VLPLVKFLLGNGMKGIKVKLHPYSARQKVSVYDVFKGAASHTLQLLQPDVVQAMQEDLTKRLTTFPVLASVAGSAIGSVGRGLF